MYAGKYLEGLYVWTVLTCIRDEHDFRLVLAAALVCVVAAATALQFHRRCMASHGARWAGWSALTGLVAGSGVWATHFVAMLAYHPELPIRFDLPITAASLAVAVIGMGGGFAFAGSRDTALRQIVGGLGVGMSIVAMHFIGVAAIRSSFGVEWNAVYVAASVVMASVGAVGALFALRAFSGWKGWVVPAACLVLGIVLLHFTAMAAVTIIPDLTLPAVQEFMSRRTLAGMTGGVSLLIVGLAAILVFAESHGHKQSLKSLEIAFKGVPSGLALFDPQGRLVIWNGAYQALIAPFGMKPQVGATRLEMLQAAAGSGLEPTAVQNRAGWAERIENERRSGGVQEWRTADGAWLRAETSKLDNGGTISVLTDITSLKAATETMALARDRAEAANRAKSEFLANMSHEIRTPLNGILGMAQVMEADELSRAQRDRVKVVRESGSALLAILNDILDLSKVQAGKLELEWTEVDLTLLSRQMAAAFEGAAAGRDLYLKVKVDEAVTGLWRADGARLRQVLSNLISNGLKFTHEGGVTLKVGRTAKGVTFAVRDTGIGIDADHLPRMFEKFSQADATITREYGGTGLGLAICRELAGLMGGEIRVASLKGKGSCFTLTLPLQQTSTVGQAPEQEVAAAAFERRLRILAAEDNPTNQLVLRSLLAPLDCELVLASNGREAVEAFGDGVYDLILMDVQMPVMSGVEATQAIRAAEIRSGAAPTPIIALSANVMSHQLSEYMIAGMNGWVAKPIELEKLYTAIEAAIAPSGSQAAA